MDIERKQQLKDILAQAIHTAQWTSEWASISEQDKEDYRELAGGFINGLNSENVIEQLAQYAYTSTVAVPLWQHLKGLPRANYLTAAETVIEVVLERATPTQKSTRQLRREQKMHTMSDQEVIDRYTKETVRLKTINQFTQQGKKRPSDVPHPNTIMINLSRQELERRGLPIPLVNLPEDEQLGTGE